MTMSRTVGRRGCDGAVGCVEDAGGTAGRSGGWEEGACAGLWYSDKKRSAGINSGRMNFRCDVGWVV